MENTYMIFFLFFIFNLLAFFPSRDLDSLLVFPFKPWNFASQRPGPFFLLLQRLQRRPSSYKMLLIPPEISVCASHCSIPSRMHITNRKLCA